MPEKPHLGPKLKNFVTYLTVLSLENKGEHFDQQLFTGYYSKTQTRTLSLTCFRAFNGAYGALFYSWYFL